MTVEFENDVGRVDRGIGLGILGNPELDGRRIRFGVVCDMHGDGKNVGLCLRRQSIPRYKHRRFPGWTPG